jgi:hypothetical protein
MVKPTNDASVGHTHLVSGGLLMLAFGWSSL